MLREPKKLPRDATHGHDSPRRQQEEARRSTTQRYVNLAKQIKLAVQNLHVPEVLRKAN